jgi:hypothetical protein
MKASLELQKSLRKYFDIHPSRLDCLCQMIVGIMSTQTSNLTKIASNFSNKAKFASCYRRIQRFFKLQNLSWCLTKVVVKYRTLKIQQVRSATLECPKYDLSI